MSDETMTIAAFKPRRAHTKSDIVGTVLTIGPEQYNAIEIDANVHGLSEVALSLLMQGLRQSLRTAPDPAKRWDEIKSGVRAVRPKAAPRARSHRREAIAYAIADAKVKTAGLRPAPNKQLSDRADYKPLLDDARQVVAKWSKERVREAFSKHDVAVHYARLTGSGGSVMEMVDEPAAVALAPE